MSLNQDQISSIYDWLYNDGESTALYELYMNDMPYGTMKARDGDPDNWLSDRASDIESDFLEEMEREALRRGEPFHTKELK